MGRLEEIRRAASIQEMMQGQLMHAVLAGLFLIAASVMLWPGSADINFAGWDSRHWAVCSLFLAVLHQVVVAIGFRLELYRGTLTRIFGAHALTVWAVVFLPLLLARPVTLVLVAWLDPNTISRFSAIQTGLGAVLLLVSAVAAHSVIRYFTIRRAIGADHFDNAVIDLPLVREGVFRYVSNAMYVLVFLALWGIALVFNSWNGLVVAAFQHAYIWVHWHATEKPDMARIYGMEKP